VGEVSQLGQPLLKLVEGLGQERLSGRAARPGRGPFEHQRGQDEALLRAVVQIALELPAGLIGRRDRARARGVWERFAGRVGRGPMMMVFVGCGRIAVGQE
jgi:hypothetical protein